MARMALSAYFMSQAQPTIFALASASGRAGIGVVRLSGPGVRQMLSNVIGACPEPRRASLRTISEPGSGEVIDRGLVIFFPAPSSFTGEDMVEFHVHGSRAVIRAVMSMLGQQPKFRMAEPGEFALRAFQNGKLDLTAAEGLADLIDAETESQRRQALMQASGALRGLYDAWRSTLIEAAAHVEAGIDFSDEADVAGHAFEMARSRVETLEQVIRKHLDDGRRGEIIREGLRIVLAGAPNAGKSSLLNALAKREAAIVSEEPGTTRDIIEVHMDLGGFSAVLCDTAGIRDAEGVVEEEGIRRAKDRAKSADVVVWVVDGSAPQTPIPSGVELGCGHIIQVLNKADQVDESVRTDESDALWISAKTGDGLSELTERLRNIATDAVRRGEGPAITQIRHRQLLEVCLHHLVDFLSGQSDEVELRAEDLRLASTALGRITGRVDVEDVLGAIFSRFCIGK